MRIISGKYGRRRFDVPTNITARPTTDFARVGIFNVLENLLDFDGLTAVDLFAGTGAVSLEMLSRGAASVTAVETAPVQSRFIRRCAETLGDPNLHVLKIDVFRYLAGTPSPVGLVFADPPYDHPRFAEIPSLVLGSSLLGPGSILVIEHSAKHDFSSLPHFIDHRNYGAVNFSIFRIPNPENTNDQ